VVDVDKSQGQNTKIKVFVLQPPIHVSSSSSFLSKSKGNGYSHRLSFLSFHRTCHCNHSQFLLLSLVLHFVYFPLFFISDVRLIFSDWLSVSVFRRHCAPQIRQSHWFCWYRYSYCTL